MTEDEPITREILRQLSVLHHKMDGVGEALQTLARVEERQAATKDTLERYWRTTGENTTAIRDLGDRLTDVQREARGRLEIHALWGLTALLGGACGFLLKLALSS